jgi:hypothetical protein
VSLLWETFEANGARSHVLLPSSRVAGLEVQGAGAAKNFPVGGQAPRVDDSDAQRKGGGGGREGGRGGGFGAKGRQIPRFGGGGGGRDSSGSEPLGKSGQGGTAATTAATSTTTKPAATAAGNRRRVPPSFGPARQAGGASGQGGDKTGQVQAPEREKVDGSGSEQKGGIKAKGVDGHQVKGGAAAWGIPTKRRGQVETVQESSRVDSGGQEGVRVGSGKGQTVKIPKW